MSIIKKVAVYFVLFCAGGFLLQINAEATFLLGAVIGIASCIALIKPFAYLGFDSRIFALIMLVFLSIPVLGVSREKIASNRIEFLTNLKATDPAAYLTELQNNNPEKWLIELALLAPKEHQAEMARRATIAAQKAEEAAAQRAEESRRLQVERDRQAAKAQRAERAQEAALAREQAQTATVPRISGAYVGCMTKAALDEFTTAAVNNDLRQIRALTDTFCISIENMEYSIVSRGFMTSQIRAYGNGNSALLWTPSEALR